jgi:hypothetical protein
MPRSPSGQNRLKCHRLCGRLVFDRWSGRVRACRYLILARTAAPMGCCLTLRCTRIAPAGFARFRTRVNSNVGRQRLLCHARVNGHRVEQSASHALRVRNASFIEGRCFCPRCRFLHTAWPIERCCSLALAGCGRWSPSAYARRHLGGHLACRASSLRRASWCA